MSPCSTPGSAPTELLTTWGSSSLVQGNSRVSFAGCEEGAGRVQCSAALGVFLGGMDWVYLAESSSEQDLSVLRPSSLLSAPSEMRI